jgi:hypothetical protein
MSNQIDETANYVDEHGNSLWPRRCVDNSTWLGFLTRAPAPRGMISAEARRLAREGGASRHSASGATLAWFLLELEKSGVEYTLSAAPGKGYVIEVRK